MEMNKKSKIERHEQICTALHSLYKVKNARYGDSFGKTFHELGEISAVTRIADKFNRLVSLTTKKLDGGDESVIDTLLDMANYCIMTVMEMESANRAKNDTPRD